MKKCKECRKKLCILEGYRHPVLGKETLLCSSCYDSIQESVDKWSEAILQCVGFFKIKNSNKNYKINFGIIKCLANAKKLKF